MSGSKSTISRKRKSSAEESSVSRPHKRIRVKTSLEQSSTTSETTTNPDDKETMNQQQSRNSTKRLSARSTGDSKYVKLAKMHGINEATAKKYYQVLKKSIYVDLIGMSGIIKNRLSKKNKRKRMKNDIQREPDPEIKMESGVTKRVKKVGRPKKFAKNVDLDSTDTLNVSVKEEPSSPEHSQDYDYDYMIQSDDDLKASIHRYKKPKIHRYKNIIDDDSSSENELQSSTPKKSKKILNPFSEKYKSKKEEKTTLENEKESQDPKGFKLKKKSSTKMKQEPDSFDVAKNKDRTHHRHRSSDSKKTKEKNKTVDSDKKKEKNRSTTAFLDKDPMKVKKHDKNQTSDPNASLFPKDPKLNRLKFSKLAASASTTSGDLSQRTKLNSSAVVRLCKMQFKKKDNETADTTKTSEIEQEEESNKSRSFYSQNESSEQAFDYDGFSPPKRSESPEKNAGDSDEDCLLLHDCDDLFDEEEEDSSNLRHSKFENERMNLDDELAYTPCPEKERSSNGFDRDTSNAATRSGQIFNRLNDTVAGNKENAKGPRMAVVQGTRVASKMGPLPASSQVSLSSLPKLSEIQIKINKINFQAQQHQQQHENDENVSFDAIGKEAIYDKVQMLNAQNKPTTPVFVKNQRTMIFLNCCYKELRKGSCSSEATCPRKHVLSQLIKSMKSKTLDEVNQIIDYAINQDFDFFLTSIWTIILPILKKNCFAAFQKYYNNNIRSSEILTELIDYCLKGNKLMVESLIKRISSIIEKDDSNSVRVICTSVKSKLKDGFCWETIKDLCQEAVPPLDMVELLVEQCLSRKKSPAHVKEVFDLVNNRMGLTDRKKMSFTMRKFYDFVQNQNLLTTKEVLDTMPLRNSGNVLNVHQTSDSSICYSNQPNQSPLEVNSSTPDRGENSENVVYIPSYNDESQVGSVWHSRFWKIYNVVHCVQTGLFYQDYEYVWDLLDEFCEKQKNEGNVLMKRAFYRILCDKVINSPRHRDGIMKQASSNDHVIVKYLNYLSFLRGELKETESCNSLDFTDIP